MRMKMNTSLCGPDVNVAPGGVHTCSPAEAIRHYRAGHATPTGECAEEFTAALAEQEAIEAAELAALDVGEGEGDVPPTPATDPAPAAVTVPAVPVKTAKTGKAKA